MRSLLVASLAFAPVLLHAQAPSPAPDLQSRLVTPVAFAVQPAVVGSVSTPLRVSTGVVAPRLIHTVDVVNDSEWRALGFAGDRTVTVSLMVDEKGVPCDMKIVASNRPQTDRNVLQAVSQFRFVPGTLNSVPAAVPVTLTVNIVHEGN